MPLPREISCAELKAWLDDSTRAKPTLLDVRRPDEWELVHIEGAVHVPLQELQQREAELKALKAPVVVYCHHGMRSLKGQAALSELGVEASSLKGGIDAWALQVAPKLKRY